MSERLTVLSHSSIEAYRSDPDVEDRYYIPWRAAAEAAARIERGQQVVTILPERKAFNEYLTLLQMKLLDGREIPTLFTPDEDYLMDADIRKYLLPDLLRRFNSNTTLHPYQATPEFYDWAGILEREKGVKIYADRKREDLRWWWGHKGAYHRWIDDLDTPSPLEELGLPIPKGYVAQTKDELLVAKRMLPTEVAVAKPIFGAGGFQIEFLTDDNIDQYEWPFDPITNQRMPVAVQERLEIARDEFGERVFSYQFETKHPMGRLTRQIMDRETGKVWSGNRVPADVSPQFEAKSKQIVHTLVSHTQPFGDGGVDIADVHGQPVIIEVNGGRPTGAHMPKRFQEAFAPKAPHFVFQKVEPNGYSPIQVWDMLEGARMPRSNEKVVFQPERQQGVFPIVWLPHSWGMLASFGQSFEEANDQLLAARDRIGV